MWPARVLKLGPVAPESDVLQTALFARLQSTYTHMLSLSYIYML